MKNYKTIKQIAEEIGVSKQAVHQKRKSTLLSTALQPFTTTVDGVVYISVDGVNLIKQAFGKNECKQIDTSFTPVDDNEPSTVYTSFTPQNDEIINILKQQIEEKDKQIAKQQKTIDELTFVLKCQTQKDLATRMIELKEQPPATIKKPFWKRIFEKSE